MGKIINFKRLYSLLLAFRISFTVQGQGNLNKGTNFWIGFIDNSAKMVLDITSDSSAKVTVNRTTNL